MRPPPSQLTNKNVFSIRGLKLHEGNPQTFCQFAWVSPECVQGRLSPLSRWNKFPRASLSPSFLALLHFPLFILTFRQPGAFIVSQARESGERSKLLQRGLEQNASHRRRCWYILGLTKCLR